MDGIEKPFSDFTVRFIEQKLPSYLSLVRVLQEVPCHQRLLGDAKSCAARESVLAELQQRWAACKEDTSEQPIDRGGAANGGYDDSPEVHREFVTNVPGTATGGEGSAAAADNANDDEEEANDDAQDEDEGLVGDDEEADDGAGVGLEAAAGASGKCKAKATASKVASKKKRSAKKQKRRAVPQPTCKPPTPQDIEQFALAELGHLTANDQDESFVNGETLRDVDTIGWG